MNPKTPKQFINRRDFLRSSIGAGILATSTMGCLSNPLKMVQPGNGEVVVIGAGIAGITVARELQSLGFGVTILEGQDRIGGRIQTDRSLGMPVELGASRVRGEKGNPLTDHIKNAGIEFSRVDWASITGRTETGKLMDEKKLSKAKPDLFRMLAKAFIRNFAKDEDSSIADVIARERALRKWTKEEELILDFSLGSGEIANGSPFAHASWKMVREFQEFGGFDQYVTNGYDALPAYLADGLDIRLNQQVQTIDYTTSPVKITTQNSTLEANYVVVTASLGVLKSNSIQFLPQLPWRKQRAIERMGMGTINKLAMRFPKSFWPTDKAAIAHGTKKFGKFPVFLNLDVYNDDEHPVLMALMGETYKNALEGVKEEDAVREAYQVLQGMYGSDIPAPTGVVRSQWQSNPFIRGAFSYNKLGAEGSDREDLAESLESRLFFAGEATHRERYGSVSGAFLSGKRATKEILEASASLRT